MRDRPGGAELLKAAQELMKRELVPQLPAKSRYKASMVLRAIQLAAAEIAADRVEVGAIEVELQAFAPLIANLRGGTFDGDAALHALLRREVALRLDETKAG